ncbi:hypothetical protein [Clostridium sp. ZBS13]|uniref:hypothetical protein n=1 Tax=Clostridium sp. ZBS13 TaxID=2949971 RepID=UPI002079ACDA|nr:hypothetical protein [Clostridium sp. ZBS13]
MWRKISLHNPNNVEVFPEQRVDIPIIIDFPAKKHREKGNVIFIEGAADSNDLDNLMEKGDTYPNHKVDSNSKSLPAKGEPNSSIDKLNSDGTVKQRRYYDQDGKAKEDIDYNHTDDGTHTFPHRHKWDWSQKKPRLDSR